MPRNLLLNAGANVYGQWVRLEPPAHKTWGYRIIVVNGSVAFAGDDVYIEELTLGLPGGPGPLQGNPGSLTPNVQTGVVIELTNVVPSGSPNGPTTDSIDNLNGIWIEAPVEYIRARCGNFNAGTASVVLIEAE